MRRRWRRPLPRAPLWLSGGLLAAVAVRLVWQTPAAPREFPCPGPCRIQHVLGGDTVELADGWQIQLAGVGDTDAQAAGYLRQFLAGGPARLEFDKERLAAPGRCRAYVWVGEQLLNEELIRAGWARADRAARIASGMKTRFRRAELEARAAGRGRWAP